MDPTCTADAANYSLQNAEGITSLYQILRILGACNSLKSYLQAKKSLDTS